MVIVQRQAVRAIILSGTHEVLLLRIRPPDGDRSFWIAPGGGLEPGENVEQGLRRELREELGLLAFTLGPLVWQREHSFSWDGRRICQRERYHIVHLDRFEPRMHDALEVRALDEFRWWRVSDLALTHERLTPLSLARIVTDYLANGAPALPLDWEILVD